MDFKKINLKKICIKKSNKFIKKWNSVGTVTEKEIYEGFFDISIDVITTMRTDMEDIMERTLRDYFMSRIVPDGTYNMELADDLVRYAEEKIKITDNLVKNIMSKIRIETNKIFE